VNARTDAAFLRVRGLELEYPDGTRALADVAFDVGEHELVAIVGPSGCGKSTLLRLAAGLLRPTAGAIELAGVEPAAARRAGHDISFVFQFPTLMPWRTVRRNVELPLELRGAPAADRGAAARRRIERVGLADFAEAYPAQLSGGMQMRASLARALVTRPDLLLLDEPFGALDEITRQDLNEGLLDLWQRDRWAALFVTHNVSEAVFLSRRVLVMSARPGRLIAEFDVAFPYPRAPALRADPAFAALAGRIGDCLRGRSP